MNVYDDGDDDDEHRPLWEEEAEDAVRAALEIAIPDEVRWAVILPFDEGPGTECASFDELVQRLEEIYDEAWYAHAPFESGEPVFFSSGVNEAVRDALAETDFKYFFIRISALRRISEWAANGDADVPLELNGLGLKDVPTEVGGLAALTELDLSDNELLELPAEIGQLSALTVLNLSNNGLCSLPPQIGQLTLLTWLDLRHNRLSALPSEIGRLTALRTLYLRDNPLTALPREIGELAQLATLGIRNCQLSKIPKEIGRLSALSELGIEHNKLRALPAEMRQLARLKGLYLHGNDGLRIPPEILGAPYEKRVPGHDPSPQVILDYYFRTRAAGEPRALNEVKVILVGQGSVGKTSLVKKVVYNTYNPHERTTDGIYIDKTWHVPGQNGQQVQVNFWDFGGQEIMHATHQFFLTKRSIYLLVLDARRGENESNIHYWLKIVASYAGNSPILVVINKCENHLDLDQTGLKQDYPNIREFVRTSCEKDEGITELRSAIIEQINSLPHVFDLLPYEYFQIKQEMEAQSKAKNYIDIRDYHALCQKHHVSARDEQDRLLRFLHDLGSVLSFTDPESPYAASLKEMSVLNPEWVTQGVYKVLNYKPLADHGGVLRRDDLAIALMAPEHPADCHDFIVNMMGKFELSFAIPNQDKWLVAELLPADQKLASWGTQNSLNFEYHYDVLPPGLICRFIVRRYHDLSDPPIHWRGGVVLEREQCKALVRGDVKNGRMRISIVGPDSSRRSLLAVICDEFAEIHRTIPNLPFKAMVPLPDSPDVAVEYEHLLTLASLAVTEFVPQGAKRKYSVMELLDGIEDMWIRYMISFHPPHVVIEPQTSFADAWETICCRALQLHNKTTEIRRRTPPESGIDLYWDARQIAYQCKSVEEASGKLKTEKAEDSLRSALKIRGSAATPWKKYIICSNAPLTGTAEERLKAICQDVSFLTPDFWEPVCRKHWNDMKDRFRLISRHAGK